MKKQTNKTNWWIDLFLFIGFILAFLLEITGLSLHQWGGLFICILAVYHLLRHWKWIVNLFKRFYLPKVGSQRIRFLIDLLLLLGFETILLTGLLISSWFDLPVNNYLLLRNIHVITSITSLVFLLIKIALHIKWINSTAQKIFRPSFSETIAQKLGEPVLSSYSRERREALRLMGTVGIASFAAILIGGNKTLQSLLDEDQVANTQTVSTATGTPENTPTPTATSTGSTPMAEPQVHNKRRNRGQSESTSTPAPTTTQEYASPQLTATPTPTSTPGTSACIVRCPKGCAYPGSCRRYIDENMNGLCDLGECL